MDRAHAQPGLQRAPAATRRPRPRPLHDARAPERIGLLLRLGWGRFMPPAAVHRHLHAAEGDAQPASGASANSGSATVIRRWSVPAIRFAQASARRSAST